MSVGAMQLCLCSDTCRELGVSAIIPGLVLGSRARPSLPLPYQIKKYLMKAPTHYIMSPGVPADFFSREYHEEVPLATIDSNSFLIPCWLPALRTSYAISAGIAKPESSMASWPLTFTTNRLGCILT